MTARLSTGTSAHSSVLMVAPVSADQTGSSCGVTDVLGPCVTLVLIAAWLLGRANQRSGHGAGDEPCKPVTLLPCGDFEPGNPGAIKSDALIGHARVNVRSSTASRVLRTDRRVPRTPHAAWRQGRSAASLPPARTVLDLAHATHLPRSQPDEPVRLEDGQPEPGSRTFKCIDNPRRIDVGIELASGIKRRDAPKVVDSRRFIAQCEIRQTEVQVRLCQRRSPTLQILQLADLRNDGPECRDRLVGRPSRYKVVARSSSVPVHPVPPQTRAQEAGAQGTAARSSGRRAHGYQRLYFFTSDTLKLVVFPSSITISRLRYVAVANRTQLVKPCGDPRKVYGVCSGSP